VPARRQRWDGDVGGEAGSQTSSVESCSNWPSFPAGTLGQLESKVAAAACLDRRPSIGVAEKLERAGLGGSVLPASERIMKLGHQTADL
jgi:hypothetical protein